MTGKRDDDEVGAEGTECGGLKRGAGVHSMSGEAVAVGLPSESSADLAAQVTPAVVSISIHRALDMSADNPAGESADRG